MIRGKAPLGPLLAIVGGALLAGSDALPWLVIRYALPGGVRSTYVEIGLHVAHGSLVALLGLLLIVLGIVMVPLVAARWPGALALALAVVAAAVILSNWMLRAGTGAVAAGTLVAALGVAVGALAAVASWPGPLGQRLALLGGAAIAGVAGSAIALSLDGTSLIPLF